MAILGPEIWPKEWHSMTVEQRADDLLKRMFALPPMKQKDFVGRSIRIPRRQQKKHDNSKPIGFNNVLRKDVHQGTLLARIEKAIPRTLPAQWRDDLIQDMAEAVLTGALKESDIEDAKAIGRMRNKVFARYSKFYVYLSTEKEPSSADELEKILAEGGAQDLGELQETWKLK